MMTHTDRAESIVRDCDCRQSGNGTWVARSATFPTFVGMGPTPAAAKRSFAKKLSKLFASQRQK